MTLEEIQKLNEVAHLASRLYYELHPKLRKIGTWDKMRKALIELGYDMDRGDAVLKENKLK